MNLNDHDLLITVSAKLDSLTDEVRNYSGGVNDKITDHENRLRLVENTQQTEKGRQQESQRRQAVVSVVMSVCLVALALFTFIWK